MSHRELDDIVELRRRLDACDVEIATAKASPVVDLVMIASMKHRREEIIAHLDRLEEQMSR